MQIEKRIYNLIMNGVSRKKQLLKKINNDRVCLEALKKLENNKEIIYQHEKYFVVKQGIISVNPKGFGFVNVDGAEDDYFVPARFMKNAVSGDEVLISLFKEARRGKSEKLITGNVLKIIERNTKEVVGRLCVEEYKNRKTYFVETVSNKTNVVVRINPRDILNAHLGDIVRVEITKYIDSQLFIGKVSKKLARVTDENLDILEIAFSYGFTKDFSPETEEETSHIPDSVDESEMKDRVDFTALPIITIDGDDSKDFDDAVSVEVLPNGNYKLGVYIADVAYYVTEGSPLDTDAYKRSTSVYLANTVIPMLPEKLSNGICSLNEGVLRFVNAAIMEIDNKGNVVDYNLCEGVIKSHHRMTYNKVNKMLVDGDKALIAEYSDIYPSLLKMQELSAILRKKRTKDGSLDFETTEYKFVLDKDYFPVEIIPRERNVSEMLIEDMMLTANETVAYHLAKNELPGMYRIHEAPDKERLSNSVRALKNMGVDVDIKDDYAPKDLQIMMKKVENTPLATVANMLLLRSQSKACYSENNLGHYGIASKYYCHFTSPIRRYPDLIVHRILKEFVFKKRSKKEQDQFSAALPEMAKHTSVCERKSIDCEREVVDMLMAKYISRHINSEFRGVIDSITSFGMFVVLPSGVEGLIHIKNMVGEYTYDESMFSLTNGKKTYKIGEQVDVVVYGVLLAERKIDFVLKEDYNTIKGDNYAKTNYKK